MMLNLSTWTMEQLPVVPCSRLLTSALMLRDLTRMASFRSPHRAKYRIDIFFLIQYPLSGTDDGIYRDIGDHTAISPTVESTDRGKD